VTQQQPFNIVVIGGGTAGWMSAAYLQKRLGRASRSAVTVTVVEAEDIDIIGVGEATIPGFVTMMRELDIPEWKLFAAADATFKNAIKFVEWGQPPAEGDATRRNYFYHPFDPPQVSDHHSAFTHWLALKEAGVAVEPLDVATSIGAALCEVNGSPKLFSSPPYEAPIPYAYHLDARKLGQLLRETAETRGVQRIVGTVTSADLEEDGSIGSVVLADGREIEGDLFVDCSGFRGLLIEGALGAPFESYNDRLLCDRAVACQVPFVEGDAAPRAFTTATAQAAGWTWEIDLSSRRGTGYVFSSKFASDDEAIATLLRHVNRPDLDLAPRVIPMKVGRRPTPWVKNCVAIGLSAGFLEPLESTGIHLIELGLRVLVDHLAIGQQPDPLRQQYNALMSETYEEIADFLMMHYIFNGRRGEPFWDHYRDHVALPPSLVRKLELWAHKVPTVTDLKARIRVFEGFSFFAILAGLQTLPPYGANVTPFIDLADSAKALDAIRSHRQLAERAVPAHAEMVQKIRATGG